MKKSDSSGVIKIAACLDMTYMDELLINYMQFYVDTFPGQYEVIFYHNIRFDFPDEANSIVESLDTPLPLILEKRVSKLLNGKFEGHGTSVLIEEKDNTAEAIYSLIKNQQQINTVFFGKKVSYEGSGYLIERLIQRDPKVNIVVVPESSGHFLNHIMVPVDFSSLSGKTVQTGIEIAEQLDAHLYFQHVYTVPGIYFPYIPVKDMENQVRVKSEKAWEKFKEKYLQNKEASIDLSFDAEKSIPQQIYDAALRERINVIIIPYEAKFMNNVAVQLLKRDMHIPIMMISMKP